MDEERRDTPDDQSTEPAGEAADDTVVHRDVENVSDTTAPSIGPNTVIDRTDEKSSEEVREASPEDPDTGMREIDLDAMGHDKRRQVVGHSYGASVGKQVAVYAIFVAVIIALAIGAKIAIDHFDKGSNPSKPEAPWAQPGVPQKAPQPLE
jgi:hypothetical protein